MPFSIISCFCRTNSEFIYIGIYVDNQKYFYPYILLLKKLPLLAGLHVSIYNKSGYWCWHINFNSTVRAKGVQPDNQYKYICKYFWQISHLISSIQVFEIWESFRPAIVLQTSILTFCIIYIYSCKYLPLRLKVQNVSFDQKPKNTSFSLVGIYLKTTYTFASNCFFSVRYHWQMQWQIVNRAQDRLKCWFSNASS